MVLLPALSPIASHALELDRRRLELERVDVRRRQWEAMTPIQRELEWVRCRGALLEAADREERDGKVALARAIRRLAR